LRRFVTALALGIASVAMPAATISKHSVAVVDAVARAEGNRRAIAISIGKSIFGNEWPA